MFKDGIKIEWPFGVEYIDLNQVDISSSKITQTIQVLKKNAEAVPYNATSEIRKSDDADIITITYKREDNQEIEAHESYWGTSTIVIPIGTEEGTATWVGSETSKYNDTAKVSYFSNGLIEPIERESINRIKRAQQSLLRRVLLDVDKVCAITSESVSEVLDVAHIHSKEIGGADILNNVILLRTDIHRLFDSGFISINLDGTINICKELSDGYQFLSKERLSPIILTRIFRALECVQAP